MRDGSSCSCLDNLPPRVIATASHVCARASGHCRLGLLPLQWDINIQQYLALGYCFIDAL